MAALNSSLESLGLSAEETTTAAFPSTAVASSMLWDGWSSHPSTSRSSGEASTCDTGMLNSTASSTSHFHHPSDLLSNMLSSFNPLSVPISSSNSTFRHHLEPSDFESTTVPLAEPLRASTYLAEIPFPSAKRDDHLTSSSQWNTRPSEWLQTVPDSCSRECWEATPWHGTTTVQLFHDKDNTTQHSELGQVHRSRKEFDLFSRLVTTNDHHASETNPVHVVTSQTNEASAMAWIPTSATQDRAPDFDQTTKGQLRSVTIESYEQVPILGVAVARQQNRRGKDKLWNESASESRRSHVASGDELGGAISGERQGPDRRGEDVVMAMAMSPRETRAWTSTCEVGASPSVSSAAQTMELFALGPALNTNGHPRARRGSATDPQSVYARQRRERINERLKVLQNLVPNGTKLDIVTMLDEAVQYVQFLQLQVKLLKSDKYWVHATPNTYMGMDLTKQPPTQMQGMGSSASRGSHNCSDDPQVI